MDRHKNDTTPHEPPQLPPSVALVEWWGMGRWNRHTSENSPLDDEVSRWRDECRTAVPQGCESRTHIGTLLYRCVWSIDGRQRDEVKPGTQTLCGYPIVEEKNPVPLGDISFGLPAKNGLFPAMESREDRETRVRDWEQMLRQGKFPAPVRTEPKTLDDCLDDAARSVTPAPPVPQQPALRDSIAASIAGDVIRVYIEQKFDRREVKGPRDVGKIIYRYADAILWARDQKPAPESEQE